VAQVSVSGFAQPTKGTEVSDLALSKARAVRISDFLGSLGISGIVEVAGKGRTNLNVASSRYAEIVVKVNPK
jgi:outer membrane protein OmpA-like peptidoglycan-associated protein